MTTAETAHQKMDRKGLTDDPAAVAAAAAAAGMKAGAGQAVETAAAAGNQGQQRLQ